MTSHENKEFFNHVLCKFNVVPMISVRLCQIPTFPSNYESCPAALV